MSMKPPSYQPVKLANYDAHKADGPAARATKILRILIDSGVNTHYFTHNLLCGNLPWSAEGWGQGVPRENGGRRSDFESRRLCPGRRKPGADQDHHRERHRRRSQYP